MISIKINDKFEPITTFTNLNVIYDYEGEQTLSFDVVTNYEKYNVLQEEGLIRYEDNLFLIKKINQRKTISTITCGLCLDGWKERLYQDFKTEYKLFAEVLELIIPNGWEVIGAGSVTGRRAMSLNGVNDYDILMHCKKLYNIVFEFHTLEKKIKVIKPDTIQSRGLYITSELNLKELIYKGDSGDFITRLYAYGKRTETRDDKGNVVSISYVNFAEINNGKTYVDNVKYNNKIISAYWQDDRYLDAQNLLDDSVEKLSSLAKPNRSYSCNLIDLSRINDKYKHLDFSLYDKVTLIDNVSRIHVQHQVVQYTDYPNDRNKNKIILSTTFKSITGTVDKINQSISSIDTEIKRNETSINEIIRDVESNTMRINNTYTKGETDIVIDSLIQQSTEEINLSISQLRNDVNQSISSFELTIDGIKQTVSKTQEALLGVTNYFKELESIKPIIEEESINGYEYINKRLKLLVVEQGIFEFYKIDNFINGFSKEKTYSTSIDVYIESEDETLEVPIVISCGGRATDFVLNNKKQRIVLEDFSFNEFETYIFNVSQGGIIIAIENIQLVLGSEYRESSKGLQEMSTEIIQSNQNIEFVKKGLEEIQSDLDGYVEKTYLEEFVRFDGAKITLGTSKSSFSTVITNSELAFYDGSTKVAFISNNAMNIFDAVIENSLTIGKFIFKPRANGNLSLMKVGDS